MSELSQNTLNLVYSLYETSEAQKVCERLDNECGTEALLCEGWTPRQMDRIRYAVLRLATEKDMCLDSAINLAKSDWRDLLLAAGFGNDLDAHEKWARLDAY